VQDVVDAALGAARGGVEGVDDPLAAEFTSMRVGSRRPSWTMVLSARNFPMNASPWTFR
jgi:hypothetical protein